MAFDIWLAFLLASCLISISPGAGAVNTMSNGLRHGVRNTLPAILGLQLGYGAQILLVGVGLGALLASSALAFSLVKWTGVAYLVWLGVQKFREGGFGVTSEDQPQESAQKRFWNAAFVNLTNPKATVFLVALFPQFVDPNASHMTQFLEMGVTLIVVDVVVMLGYATLASRLLGWLKTPARQRHMNRVFGSLFMGAAVLMASYRHGQ